MYIGGAAPFHLCIIAWSPKLESSKDPTGARACFPLLYRRSSSFTHCANSAGYCATSPGHCATCPVLSCPVLSCPVVWSRDSVPAPIPLPVTISVPVSRPVPVLSGPSSCSCSSPCNFSCPLHSLPCSDLHCPVMSSPYHPVSSFRLLRAVPSTFYRIGGFCDFLRIKFLPQQPKGEGDFSSLFECSTFYFHQYGTQLNFLHMFGVNVEWLMLGSSTVAR